MIKKLVFAGSPSDQQEEAHAMCRDGLVDYKPVLLTARDARRLVNDKGLDAIHEIEKDLETGQWIASVELYDSGRALNMWIAYNGNEGAVALYTYREEGEPVEQPVTKKRRVSHAR